MPPNTAWKLGKAGAPEGRRRHCNSHPDACSAKQLSLKKATSLPLLIAKEKQALNFEDLYVAAKQRNAKKSAEVRKGGTSPLLSSGSSNPLLRSGNTLPDLPNARNEWRTVDSPTRSRAFRLADGAAAAPGPDDEWASKALRAVPAATAEERASAPAPAAEHAQSRSTQQRGSVAPPSAAERALSKKKMSVAPQKALAVQQAVRALPLLQASRQASRCCSRQPSPRRDSVRSENDGLRSLDDPEGGAADVTRMQTAFNRFKVYGENDLHASDLPELLRYLGHVVISPESVAQVHREVTAYDYMDFEEFTQFRAKFRQHERDQFRTVFDEFDDDKSGEISVQELRRLMRALGFIPLRGMIQEALEVVDSDSNGQLDFEELTQFLKVYMHAEGFTKAEVGELRRNFNRLSIMDKLPPDWLPEVIIKSFGSQSADIAKKLAEQFEGEKVDSALDRAPRNEAEHLTFSEFLVVARTVRESQRTKILDEFAQAELSSERVKFNKLDADKSGGISQRELKKGLRRMRYTPLTAVLNEVCAEVVEGVYSKDRELDFDEFFDFMLVFTQREGFMKAQVEEMRATFDRFDADDSGEINVMELGEMLRFLGNRVTQEELHLLIIDVDTNGSGQLDFREFLGLSRLLRERECERIRGVFDALATEEELLPGAYIAEALHELGHETPDPFKLVDAFKFIEYDGFVGIVDSCRAEFVAKERKKAGFSDREIDRFKEQFDGYDKDHSGDIDVTELQEILREYGWEPRSREQQQGLLTKIEEARALAREAGVEDVGGEGFNSIKFWVFVRLARTMRAEKEKEEEEHMVHLTKKLQFTDQEVDQFRQIFVSRFQGVLEEDPDFPKSPQKLPYDHVRRLLRSLGLSVSGPERQRLDKQIQSLDEQGRKETAELTFPNFLCMMRWLLDTDYGGINAKLAGE